MNLTQAFHDQNEAARLKQTEAEYTAHAEEMLLQKLYPPMATWFRRKYNELQALSVRNVSLGEPTSGGRGATRLFVDPITLSFVPAQHGAMVYHAQMLTRTDGTQFHLPTEANRQTGLKLTWQYWMYGSTEHVVTVLFDVDALTNERVFALLDTVWDYLDQYALEGLAKQQNFWRGIIVPRPFLVGDLTMSRQ